MSQLSTIMYIPFFRLDRQEPADAVWPVLIPYHPFFNSLFVFDHTLVSCTDSKSSL